MKNKLLLTDTFREILQEYISIAFINFEFTEAADLLQKLEQVSNKQAVLIKCNKNYKINQSHSKGYKEMTDGWQSLYFEDENLKEHFEKFGYVTVKPCWDEAKWQSLIFFTNTITIQGSCPFVPLVEYSDFNYMHHTYECSLKQAIANCTWAINERRLLTKKLLNLIGSSSVYYFNSRENEDVFTLFLNKEISVAEKKKYLTQHFMVVPFSLKNLHQVNFEENKKIIFYDRFNKLQSF